MAPGRPRSGVAGEPRVGWRQAPKPRAGPPAEDGGSGEYFWRGNRRPRRRLIVIESYYRGLRLGRTKSPSCGSRKEPTPGDRPKTKPGVYRLRMPVARQVRPLQLRRCGGQSGYRSAIPSGGLPSGSTTPAVTCGVRRNVVLGPLTASASRRPTDSPRSSGRETLSVLVAPSRPVRRRCGTRSSRREWPGSPTSARIAIRGHGFAR